MHKLARGHRFLCRHDRATIHPQIGMDDKARAASLPRPPTLGETVRLLYGQHHCGGGSRGALSELAFGPPGGSSRACLLLRLDDPHRNRLMMQRSPRSELGFRETGPYQ